MLICNKLDQNKFTEAFRTFWFRCNVQFTVKKQIFRLFTPLPLQLQAAVVYHTLVHAWHWHDFFYLKAASHSAHGLLTHRAVTGSAPQWLDDGAWAVCLCSYSNVSQFLFLPCKDKGHRFCCRATTGTTTACSSLTLCKSWCVIKMGKGILFTLFFSAFNEWIETAWWVCFSSICCK